MPRLHTPQARTPRRRGGFVLAGVLGRAAEGTWPRLGVGLRPLVSSSGCPAAAVAVLSALLTACGADFSTTSRGLSTGVLRIVAANLSSGNRQSWEQGHGGRILDALDADVILMQEFSVGRSTPTELRAFVDDHLGPEFEYARESASLPNGIISRWPILRSGTWRDAEVSNRGFFWAEIDLPGPTDLFAVSVHFLTSNATRRRRQAEGLLRQLDSAVPANDLLVVGGDLNVRSPGESALRTLGRRVDSGRRPTDQHGNPNTNSRRNAPLDWVLPSPTLEALHVAAEVGDASFPDGLVFDTRLFAHADLAPPARRTDSAAPGMQHMAVVRDFAIP